MKTVRNVVASAILAALVFVLLRFVAIPTPFPDGWGVWWTWVVVTGLYGLFVGLGCKGIDLEDGVFEKKEFIRFSIVCVISCILCWGVIAPIGDILIYAEPANLVFIQGLFVGLSGMIASLVVGGILCKAYAASRAQKGSLTKED